MATEKKSAAKKPEVRKVGGRVLKPAKKKPQGPKRKVSPVLVKKLPAPVRNPVIEVETVDSSKAVEIAMNIALEMKRKHAEADRERNDENVRLTRRPTTRSQGRNTEKFPEADLKDFKKRLLEARQNALKGVSAMRQTGFNGADDREADGGDGTNQTLRLQALNQVENINRTIQKIDEALHRIEDGTYGICTSCGQLIRKPRLLNQPFVLTCMECQNEMERTSK